MSNGSSEARAARWLRVAFLLLAVPAAAGPPATGPDAQPATAPRLNRLSGESSPCLQLHADNPVDWYPWGAEALERARREEKPIFLSVGYSTCYWCHVMERRVFSDAAIAELMNRWFVNIKVDREERPDIDEIYMTSTRLLTGLGGWPNSVFLTPAAEPFFAGTYFPPQDENGRPGFPTVLRAGHEAWRERRDAVEQLAAEHAERLRAILGAAGEPVADELPLAAATRAVQELQEIFDPDYGGFGRAPKFPSCASLALLWNRAEEGDAAARRMVLQTLRAMGRGAIYDQLGGGFHRYTLDRAWRLPHFQKMLYDNAQLLELLARVAAATGDAEIERLARGTADFLLAELRLPNAGFKSAIDAETDGEEGAFYVWSRQQLEAALGREDFRVAAPILGFDGEPKFEGSRHTLYLTDALERHAERLGLTPERFWSRWRPLLARPRPRVDDKVLTDWNGLTIAALARAGRSLAEDRYLQAAVRAAEFVSTLRDENGRLQHVWRNGESKIHAFLDDYAFLVHGLLALADATGERRWLRWAEELTQELERHLREPRGGFFGGPADPVLLVRSRPAGDGALPAGNGVAARNLLGLAERTGRPLYRWRAEAAIRALASELDRAPAPLPTLALATLEAGAAAAAAGDRGVAAGSPPQSAMEIVEARLQLGDAGVAGWRWFVLELRIQDGWHLNANPATSEFLVPTRVGGDLRGVEYPPAGLRRFRFAGEKLRVYEGDVAISDQLAADAAGVLVTYQACDDHRCLPPITRSVTVAESAAGGSRAGVP